MGLSNPAEMVHQLQNEWHEFKADNDRRLAEIKATGRADPLTEEKIDRHSKAIGELQAQLDDLQKVGQRRGAAPASEDDRKKAEHRKAFEAFMRRGKEDGLAQLQASVNLGSDEEGGFLVPDSVDSAIEQIERDNTPMRQLCRVIPVSNEGYEKLVNLGGSGSGWVDETESRPETTTPTLAALKPYFGEIYANPAATQKSLDDAAFNVESWLAEEVAIDFAEKENDAFTSGNGVKKPKGILGYTLSTSADGTRSFGEIQKVHSGSSGAFVADKLIDLVYSLKRGYRMNAAWMTTALALAAIRKLKDGQNNYLFQPSFVAGQPQMLLGYPIEENDDVPVPAADAKAVIFGDFRRGYCIVDVRGVRVTRDPYTNKPKVHFYTTKRVGGFVVNDRALKVYVLST